MAQNVADPECRSVASKAHATLLKVGADGKVTGIVANEAEVLAQLGSAVANVGGQVGEVVVKYVASLLCGLINASKYKEEQWIEVCFVTFLVLLAFCCKSFVCVLNACCMRLSIPAALHPHLLLQHWYLCWHTCLHVANVTC